MTAHMTTHAPQIGKVLKAAGLAKAGRYVPYGHRDPGYTLYGSYDGTVSVLPVGTAAERSQIGYAAEAALRAKGYVTEREGGWDETDRHASFWVRVTGKA